MFCLSDHSRQAGRQAKLKEGGGGRRPGLRDPDETVLCVPPPVPKCARPMLNCRNLVIKRLLFSVRVLMCVYVYGVGKGWGVGRAGRGQEGFEW